MPAARKPIKLHEKEGTYRKDRHAARKDGVEFTGQPKRPPELVGEAMKLWNRVVPQMIEAGYVSEMDTHNLASMCHWWAIWKAHLEYVYTDHKCVYTAKAAWQEFSRIAHDYGLDPASREKLRSPPKAESDGLLQMYNDSAG